MKARIDQSTPRISAVAAISLLLLFCALTALAQSGRRTKKSTPLPPVPTPEASPTPTPRKTPERPAIPILLGANTFDTTATASIPHYFEEAIVKSCAQGLQKDGAVHVEPSSRNLTRGDAVKRAKEAKEGYVVLLELRSDRMRSSTGNSELSGLYIDYVAFAAVSGRPVTSGSVYQQAGVRDVILGRSDSTAVTEERLKVAARVAAQRILGAIGGRER